MKLLKITAAAAAAFMLAAAVSAEDINLLENYRDAQWAGDPISYDENSEAIYFSESENESFKAVFEADMNENASGFFFYIDGGNGVNVGDSGKCEISFTDSGGNTLFSASTGEISGLENFSRFSIGEEECYYPVPEGAEKVRITIFAQQKDSLKKVSVYFRNLALYMSGDKMLSLPDSDGTMNVAAGLTRVEVGINPATRWIWIGIVFAVAMAFYFIKMWREKYKTAAIMKAGRK